MRTIRCLSLLFLVAAQLQAQPRPNDAADFSDRAETARMTATAGDLFGLKLADVKAGSKWNFVALNAAGGVVFTRRNDSRTYIVYDPRAEGEAMFTGSDERLIAMARKLLAGVGVPAAEIADAKVLQEMTQEAEIDPQSGAARPTELKKGNRRALLTRNIEGIPVFSSRELLALNRRGGVYDLEMHWPEIPRAVIDEAHRLQYIVRNGWKPPEERGARAESVEAGIIHSPAVASVMDIVPVIRVIYASVDKNVGVKSQRFFDRNGDPVNPPRQTARVEEPCSATPRAVK
jgi:hypothetical protein